MPFTPVQTYLGGVLLHLSTSSLLVETGRVFGISSVLDGAIWGDGALWRWAILTGLVAGPALAASTGIGAAFAVPDAGLASWAALSGSRLALAGALVGFGSKLGSGCTSGHMLCGVSRLSPRSLLATATFFLTAVLTARFFPAPLHESASVSAAYTPTYPSKASLAVLGGTVVLAALARQAIAALVPRAMKYLRSRSADEPQTEAVAPPSTAAEHALASVPYFTSGLTFSLGLAASGMIDPLKVLGFLRLPPPAESFDPSLAMVVLGGLIPNAIHWVLASRNPKPHLAWEKWQVPSRTDFDWRLVTGAAAFGAGWGLAGVCPGPAIETAGSLVAAAVQGVDVSVAAQGWAAYFANLLLGMGAVRVLEAAL